MHHPIVRPHLLRTIRLLEQFLAIYAPRVYWRLKNLQARVYSWVNFGKHRQRKRNDIELFRYLCDPGKLSIDVGAHRGTYTYPLAKYSRTVLAFEPIPHLADLLKRIYDRSPFDVKVEAVALSDIDAKGRVRMPVRSQGSATLEQDNAHVNKLAESEEIAEIEVTLKRLDDYGLDDVEFIKVDVEGHQLPLIRGARNTLQKFGPSIYMEIQNAQLPNSMLDIPESLGELGYRGYFLAGDMLIAIDAFNSELFHNPKNREVDKLHITDFFFLHRSRIEDIKRRCAHIIFLDSDNGMLDVPPC